MIVPLEAKKALPIIQKHLEKSLVAVYLHGSAVAGGLRLHSDVDLLAVIDKPMKPKIRENLAADLMQISGRYPTDPEGRRPLEVIVFLQDDLSSSPYPAKSEFIYGEWLRAIYKSGKIPKPVCDPELTLVLAHARQEAIPLLGSKVAHLLPTISKADIRRAIRDCLPNLIATLQGDERNVLLTLARMWLTSVTGKFVSKDIAADWAMDRLPPEQATILADARKSYLGIYEENWQNRQKELRLTVNTLHNVILENL